MTRKIIAILLLLCAPALCCACAGEAADAPPAAETPAVTLAGDSAAAELVLTYADGREARFSLADKLLMQGSYPPEFADAVMGSAAAAYGETAAVFIPASFYFEQPRDHVLEISRDNGETWQELTVPRGDNDGVFYSLMGFTAPEHIWLLLQGGVAMGRAPQYLYISDDGGLTWQYGDLPQPAGGWVVDYATFLDENEGYISAGSGRLSGPAPHCCRTADGGQTWQECTFETDFADDYFWVEEIARAEEGYRLRGRLQNADSEVYFTSADGLFWQQEK